MKIRMMLMVLMGASACNSASTPDNTSSVVDTHVTTTALTNSGDTSSTSTTNSSGSSGSITIIATPTPASTGGTALVWSGSGACTDGCALAGHDAAVAAGLTPVYVDGTSSTKSGSSEDIVSLFSSAKVWIMPGGTSNTEYNAMSAALRTTLQAFVQNGGGYVGWCAGAFAATAKIGTTGATGLGIFPGSTALYYTSEYQNSYGGSIEPLKWLGISHDFYLEGGPYLYNLPSTVEVVATYEDNSVAAARTTYGSGRVFVSGVHPEAPSWWWENTGISDSDGSDTSYAAAMIKWAAGQSN